MDQVLVRGAVELGPGAAVRVEGQGVVGLFDVAAGDVQDAVRFAAGPFQDEDGVRGVYDMCGNVWEWCSTETKPGRHELKGGAWTSPFNRATPSSFNDAAATMCDDDTGFRCVVSAETLEKMLSK